MRWIILVALLITPIFPSSAEDQQLTRKCDCCNTTFNFDSRDVEYANWWINYHMSECPKCKERPAWQPEPQYGPYKPGIRQLPGYMFLGGLAGGLLWPIVTTDFLEFSDPEVIRAAGEGAFYGAVAMALLWVVSAI